MTYNFSLTLSQSAVLHSMQGQAVSGSILYADCYAYIISCMTDPLTGSIYSNVDPSVWNWFKGAEQVNRGVGTFSGFIREYTAEQYRIRTGQEPSSGIIQDASNKIANSVIDDILQNQGMIPSLRKIGENDAAGSVDAFPNQDPAAWSGNILFIGLGDRYFFDQYILDSTDPYDFLSMVQASSHAGLSSWFSFDPSDAGNLFSTAWNLLSFDLFGAIWTAVEDGANYIQNIYGIGDISIPFDSVKVDFIGNNGQITGGSGRDIVYGADGNDTLNMTDGSDILDGGSGVDTARVQGIVSVEYNSGSRSSSANYVGSLSFGLLESSLFNIERIVTGGGNDRFNIGQSALVSYVDGGTGVDTIDFSQFASAVTIDAYFNNAMRSGNLEVYGIERFLGSTHNDTFADGSTTTLLSGGGGDDIFTLSWGANSDGGSGDDLFIVKSSFNGKSPNINGGDDRDILEIKDGSFEWLNLNTGVYHKSWGTDGSVQNIEEVRIPWGIVHGSSGADQITVTTFSGTYAGNGTAFGGAGNDHLYTEGLTNAYLYGGDGNDTIIGHGSDHLFGDNGDDEIHGGARTQYISGGNGDDVIYTNPDVGRITEVRTGHGTDYVNASGISTSTEVYYDFTKNLLDSYNDSNGLISVIDTGNGVFAVNTTQGIDYISGVANIFFESPGGIGGYTAFWLEPGISYVNPQYIDYLNNQSSFQNIMMEDQYSFDDTDHFYMSNDMMVYEFESQHQRGLLHDEILV